MLRSVSLAIALLAAGLSFGSSVGVYAPAIVPVNTLKPDEWKKYDPAAFGSNTTGKIQAFYDMMCERVDVIAAGYAYSASKTTDVFTGCPIPSRRAALYNYGTTPSLSLYTDMYEDMCDFLSYVHAEPSISTLDGYSFPQWESRLCYDIGLSVSASGITTTSADIYPFSLSRFGYSGSIETSIQNHLSDLATTLGIEYTAADDSVTAADIDDKFCRFNITGTTNVVYIDELDHSSSNMYWAPLYAFDRICADVASRNVSIVQVPASAATITGTRSTYTYTFAFDTDTIAAAILDMYNGYSAADYFTPTGVSITVSEPTSYTLSTPWASAQIKPTITVASGYINSIGGEATVSFSSQPKISFTVERESSSMSISGNISCANRGFILRPEYFDKSDIHLIGKTTVVSLENSGSVSVYTNMYYAEATSTSAVISAAIESGIPAAYQISDDDVWAVLTNITDYVGGLTVSVSGGSFSSSYANGSVGRYRLSKSYGMPYAICENKYNFTEWSGHVGEYVNPRHDIGPQEDYGDGDGGVDDFDVWVDINALPNGDGSRNKPFNDLDVALASVNPNGGARANTNRVPKVGMMGGRYPFPAFLSKRLRPGSVEPPAYDVRLIGIGTGVTLVRDPLRYFTGHYTITQSSGGVYYMTQHSRAENLTFEFVYGTRYHGPATFTFVNCRFKGQLHYRDEIFGSCIFYNCHIDGLEPVIYDSYSTWYKKSPMFNGVAAYDSVFEFNIPTGQAYGLCNNLCYLENTFVRLNHIECLQAEYDSASRKSLDPIFSGCTVWADQVDQVNQNIVPISATNCLFFIDGIVNNPPYTVDNIMDDATNATSVIDTDTYVPNKSHDGIRAYGYKGFKRKE